MPIFKYQAYDSNGTSIKDEVETVSYDEAIEAIRSNGYYPTSVKQFKDKIVTESTTTKKRKKSLKKY